MIINLPEASNPEVQLIDGVMREINNHVGEGELRFNTLAALLAQLLLTFDIPDEHLPAIVELAVKTKKLMREMDLPNAVN